MSEILTLDGILEGSLSSLQSVTGDISKALTISGSVTPGAFYHSLPIYEGVYQVTSLPTLDLILQTGGKQLQSNIVVNKIPYFETTNDSGGYTVTIG